MATATIEEYLAVVPPDKRAALERLREQIRAAVPEATEAISYGMPAFILAGRWFVGFGATKTKCSFYAGRAPIEAFATELKGYRLWKGTINFQADRPIPGPLVTKLLQARLEEYRPG